MNILSSKPNRTMQTKTATPTKWLKRIEIGAAKTMERTTNETIGCFHMNRSRFQIAPNRSPETILDLRHFKIKTAGIGRIMTLLIAPNRSPEVIWLNIKWERRPKHSNDKHRIVTGSAHFRTRRCADSGGRIEKRNNKLSISHNDLFQLSRTFIQGY